MSCGGGTRTRTRTIKQTAEHGGDECPEKNLTEIMKSLEPEDLIKYGLIPEFIGRMPIIFVFTCGIEYKIKSGKIIQK